MVTPPQWFDILTFFISVWVPVGAAVGMWEGTIETWHGDKAWITKKHVLELPVYVLFNPFNPKDSTYMQDPEMRQEYLMEDMETALL